ncbi:LptF/LptG family permease [Flagellimonas pelagia]|uniref:LptF/LptG family permease n=1 Tax=Flagellimonas pelagia TaxID=2306998 RepID=UPI0026BC9FF7|nr:LptF/LptG family permease [Allomuricauda maritima]
MKILDQYILRRFLYNFFSSFFILIVIFIFQGIWLFIDDLAGKGLGIVIIAKFIFYFIPTLIDKVLPLTVLLSSILTFGTFAENYEFAAMKASGISLQRGMRSLIVFVLFLGVVTFFFANNVIPKSEQKMFNLRRNIAKVKPAAAITEGVFSDFEGTGQGMNIKVDRKHGEQDRFLENVIIHKKNNQNINTTVIKAKSGELISSEESDIIQLVLKDGNYYEELTPKDAKERRKEPFAKSDFETYTINIDISELNDQDLEEDQNITTNKMKNVSRLIKDIDSLRENNLEKVEAFSKNIVNRMGAFPVIVKKDSIEKKSSPELIVSDKDKKVEKDSIRTVNDLLNSMQTFEQLQVMKKAKNDVSGILSTVIAKKDELQTRYKFYNSHILSLHQKYALALSCIILFFVGAPLGAIIRKGGLGLPMVIAIVLFLTYYFIGVFAGNYAKEGNIHPALGAWLSTLIMMPLGISLTKRATADKGLFGFGNIFDRIKSIFKKREEEAEADEEINLDAIDINSELFMDLSKYPDNRLVDMTKNYKQYEYSKEYRNTALKVLETRGTTVEVLRYRGDLSNEKYEKALENYSQYLKYADWALNLYFISLVLPIILAFTGIQLPVLVSVNVLIYLVFLYCVARSSIQFSNLYKLIGKDMFLNPILIFFIGMLAYVVIYYINRKHIRKDLNSIR